MTLQLGDTTLGVRCDDQATKYSQRQFQGGWLKFILTLERVVGFCEYSIVNMIIIDQLKHRTDYFSVDNQISTNSSAEIGHIDIYLRSISK